MVVPDKTYRSVISRGNITPGEWEYKWIPVLCLPRMTSLATAMYANVITRIVVPNFRLQSGARDVFHGTILKLTAASQRRA